MIVKGVYAVDAECGHRGAMGYERKDVHCMVLWSALGLMLWIGIPVVAGLAGGMEGCLNVVERRWIRAAEEFRTVKR